MKNKILCLPLLSSLALSPVYGASLRKMPVIENKNTDEGRGREREMSPPRGGSRLSSFSTSKDLTKTEGVTRNTNFSGNDLQKARAANNKLREELNQANEEHGKTQKAHVKASADLKSFKVKHSLTLNNLQVLLGYLDPSRKWSEMDDATIAGELTKKGINLSAGQTLESDDNSVFTIKKPPYEEAKVKKHLEDHEALALNTSNALNEIKTIGESIAEHVTKTPKILLVTETALSAAMLETFSDYIKADKTDGKNNITELHKVLKAIETLPNEANRKKLIAALGVIHAFNEAFDNHLSSYTPHAILTNVEIAKGLKDIIDEANNIKLYLKSFKPLFDEFKVVEKKIVDTTHLKNDENDILSDVSKSFSSLSTEFNTLHDNYEKLITLYGEVTEHSEKETKSHDNLQAEYKAPKDKDAYEYVKKEIYATIKK